jgi:hypothetical protein
MGLLYPLFSHNKLHLTGAEAATPVTVAPKHINTHIHIQVTGASIKFRNFQVLFLPSVVQEDAITVIEERSENSKHSVILPRQLPTRTVSSLLQGTCTLNSITTYAAVHWLKQFVTGFSTRRASFNFRPVHAGLLADEVALGEGFL